MNYDYFRCIICGRILTHMELIDFAESNTPKELMVCNYCLDNLEKEI